MTLADFLRIKCALEDYWDVLHETKRIALEALHHPFLVHEFPGTALVVRDADTIAAYLLGFVSLKPPIGYIHIVGVRHDRRRTGLGRLLYESFENLARDRRATSLTAITTPSNQRSAAFHAALGFSTTPSPDYSGSGEAEVLLSAIPHPRFATVPRTAHAPSLERPDAFNAVVLPFLGDRLSRLPGARRVGVCVDSAHRELSASTIEREQQAKTKWDAAHSGRASAGTEPAGSVKGV